MAPPEVGGVDADVARGARESERASEKESESERETDGEARTSPQTLNKALAGKAMILKHRVMLEICV